MVMQQQRSRTAATLVPMANKSAVNCGDPSNAHAAGSMQHLLQHKEWLMLFVRFLLSAVCRQLLTVS